MSLVLPPSIVLAFAFDAGPDYIAEVPVDSQIGIENGVASYTDGFPPLNFLDPTLGGIPPRGKDFNGILYAISANVAWMRAGMPFTFNGALPLLATGYNIGAMVVASADPATFFFSKTNNNADNPEVDPTNWVPYSPIANVTGYATVAPAAGTYDDFSVDPGVGTLDIDTTLGDVVITGFYRGYDGRRLTVSNTGPNLLTILANSLGSVATGRVRMAADLTLTTNGSVTIKTVYAISRWIQD